MMRMVRIRRQRLGQIGTHLNLEIMDQITGGIGFRDSRQLTCRHSRVIHWAAQDVPVLYAPHGGRHIFTSPMVRVIHFYPIAPQKCHGHQATRFMIRHVLHGHGGRALVIAHNKRLRKNFLALNMNLNTILSQALKKNWSTGHFNFSELDQARAIVEQCAQMRAPAILGTSEGERKHVGLTEAVAIRDAFRKDFDIPIFLNADHTKSVEAAKMAIDAGYDSIHIDLSAMPFEDNIAGTKKVVEYMHLQHPASSFSQSSVEGELGYLRGESKIQKEKIEVRPEDYTQVEQAREFVEKTGINRLAIAVGNIHGISLDEPNLDIERIRAIRTVVPEEVALVLHAGSGIPDAQIKAAIEAGIANIHINTDLRVAYTSGLRKSFQEHPDEVVMYKLDQPALDALKAVLKEKLLLFNAAKRV